jgi:alkylated DNA repair dioxygenase AlkB
MAEQTRAEFVRSVRAERQVWQSLVAEVGPARMDEPGAMGEWTFKDMVAHLLGWRNHRIRQLKAATRGGPEPAPPWPPKLDDDRVNDWLRRWAAVRSLDDVLAEYDASFEHLAKALEALPEA